MRISIYVSGCFCLFYYGICYGRWSAIYVEVRFVVNRCYFPLCQAEAASDEVYAQVSLVPESEVGVLLILPCQQLLKVVNKIW